uniref:Secreted protein n=1 Tax=Anguilla anguilla TaxID=7936 RepID=A0A0E9PQT5_ANGAN
MYTTWRFRPGVCSVFPFCSVSCLATLCLCQGFGGLGPRRRVKTEEAQKVGFKQRLYSPKTQTGNKQRGQKQ